MFGCLLFLLKHPLAAVSDFDYTQKSVIFVTVNQPNHHLTDNPDLMNRLTLLMASMLSLCTSVMAHGAETINFDENWKFAFGNAADPAKDFGCGTEYFNYLTKAASIHNEGPYSPKFDPAKWDNEWKEVNLPHDWVVDLPFSSDASHSHGYKTVGYKYPETSVGWYRKVFSLPADDLGRRACMGQRVLPRLRAKRICLSDL